MITLAQARSAIDAVVKAVAEAGFAVAVAIVDEHGDLIAAQRMDGCRPRSMRMTQRKAYTAAVMDRNSTLFAEEVEAKHLQLAAYGDAMLTTLPGGVVVKDAQGATLGAIAVTGNTKNRDEEFARAGIPLITG